MPGQVTLRGGILDVYSPESRPPRPHRLLRRRDRIHPQIRPRNPALRLAPRRSPAPPPHRNPGHRADSSPPSTPATRAAPQAQPSKAAKNPPSSSTHVSHRAPEKPPSSPAGSSSPASPAPTAPSSISSPRSARVFVEEPAMVKNQGERWWNKVEQRHDRSGIGILVRPEDIYLSPWDLDDSPPQILRPRTSTSSAQSTSSTQTAATSREIDFATRPTLRFHGSIPALIEHSTP